MQSVLTRDGVPMDGDVVLNEMLENGDEVFVEFGPGPQQFRVPWDGRPKTPPFKWSDGQLVLPRYDEWLTGMDLGAEGLDYLIVGGEEDHGAGKTQQLAEVKSVLQARRWWTKWRFVAWEAGALTSGAADTLWCPSGWGSNFCLHATLAGLRRDDSGPVRLLHGGRGGRGQRQVTGSERDRVAGVW